MKKIDYTNQSVYRVKVVELQNGKYIAAKESFSVRGFPKYSTLRADPIKIKSRHNCTDAQADLDKYAKGKKWVVE